MIYTMVDFVKITIPPEYIEGIWYNQILEFISEHSESTGEETSNKSIAEHQGLKFIIYKNSKYAEIQGSLHKYFNKGKHNANDFSLANLLEVLEDINTKFQIPIETFKLSNIEFGVNIEPPIKTNLILNNLLYHHGNKFKDIYIKGGNYKQVEHTRYYLKMYNKYVQYKDKYVLPDIENMRIEMKYVRMKDLNKDGLYCLQDLCKPTVLGAIYDLLIKSWANTLLFDKTINRKALKSN